MEARYPSRVARGILWLLFNVLIFFAVAITNGFLVFFLAVLSSCLASAWMITAFLVRPARHGTPLPVPLAIILVAIGAVGPMAFTNANPFYAATILGVVIHEMRVLNRFVLGPIAAVCAPLVSILPLIPTSHAAYSQLTLSPETAFFEPIIGYLLVLALLIIVFFLLKADDRKLLPLVGKTHEQCGERGSGGAPG
jgi:hypothetical protein